ncbi:ABC transporter ATP-binding protein [Aeromicrobium alkaliterrae]|uniref:ABC transporter ATP-binding protein n=2 Tax=Aeromicrobium alkaliterrae TaxID=302168 RepID=A0ABN2JWX6_9ACTN
MIEVRGLRKTYGSTVAVDRVDLEVAEGEVLGVLGPNGAGKSTTVECIAGLTSPDAGTVRVAGLDPIADRDAARRLVGVQLQEAGLQAKLTVREALRLFASFHEHPRDGIELAERLGLGERLDHRYAALSGGQKQRIAIALSLVGRPRVALLDELSTGLDPESRRQVWDLVEEIRHDGTTIVLVTHLMEEAHRLCDRLALIDRGQVAAVDTPAGLIGRSAAPTVMTFDPVRPVSVEALARLDGVADVSERGGRVQVVGTDDAVLLVLDHLGRSGVRPTRLRVSETSLDDAYLALVTSSEEETA